MSQQVEDREFREGVPEVEFVVSGMTCGSCAARVQRALSRHPGVTEAGVNFATARASVAFDPAAVAVDDLVTAVNGIGYGLEPATEGAGEEKAERDEAEEVEAAAQAQWLRRTLVAWPLGLTVMYLAFFVEPTTTTRWSQLLLTAPVQLWAGWPFLKGAVARARHRSANMDTLIAIGTMAAFLFSTYELAAGGELYFEIAALLIAFLTLGRYFEARTKR